MIGTETRTDSLWPSRRAVEGIPLLMLSRGFIWISGVGPSLCRYVSCQFGFGRRRGQQIRFYFPECKSRLWWLPCLNPARGAVW